MTTRDQIASQISGDKFPALRAFLRGYLHEDVADEYGTAVEAVEQFCEDADAHERKTVAAEWLEFVEKTHGLPLRDINQLLARKLGGAYLVASEDELQKITDLFRQRCRK
jgi:hypothetical protein